MRVLFFVLLIAAAAVWQLTWNKPQIAVGSKIFTESYILGEIFAQSAEQEGYSVSRRLGMGGTGILFGAISRGEIMMYPEYLGTIAREILKDPSKQTAEQIREGLRPLGLVIGPSLGFSNTYALAVRRQVAQDLNLTKISDINRVRDRLRVAFSHEFRIRADGYPGLRKAYGLEFSARPLSMDHTLAYEAARKNEVDLIDVYSTDAKIAKLDLVVLEDDRGFFPAYEAVILARAEVPRLFPNLWGRLGALRIDVGRMRALNAGVDLEQQSFEKVATSVTGYSPRGGSAGSVLRQRTQEHLSLVGLALIFSIVVGVPLGILASRYRVLGQGILLVSGLVQTIPSLAMLCLLIPLFGIGFKPALVALCLYGLLPVVSGTFTGLRNLDPRLLEMSKVLGLTPIFSLRHLELPMASRSVFNGIKTSAIISIGTATLAALIGAGGYGAIIVAGLAVNDIEMVLAGALPAAGMALLAHIGFEIAERYLIPWGV